MTEKIRRKPKPVKTHNWNNPIDVAAGWVVRIKMQIKVKILHCKDIST